MKRQVLFLRKIKNFFVTALIGGTLVILPVAILIVVVKWIFTLLSKFIDPITRIVVADNDFNDFLVDSIAITILIVFSFLVGLVVRTRIGNMLFLLLENNVFSRVPFYLTIKDTVQHLFGKKQPFSKIVIVNVYGNDTRMTGFVTDEHDNGYVTVFIPTGPNPTSGNIFHVKRHQLEFVKVHTEDAMRTIIACGAGSSELLKSLNQQEKDISSTMES